MKYTKIYDLSGCPVSERNGMYSGRGFKEGITIENYAWAVSFECFEFVK